MKIMKQELFEKRRRTPTSLATRPSLVGVGEVHKRRKMSGDQRYVSRELSHFVGRGLSHSDEQFDLLIRILHSGWLTHPPHNQNISGNLTVNTSARLSRNEMYAPQVVCLCDIPIGDLHIHTAKYSAFGLSFSKNFIASKGGAPVFYLPWGAKLQELKSPSPDLWTRLDLTRGLEELFQDVSLGDKFDEMVPELHKMMDLFRRLIMEARTTPGVPDEHRRLHGLLHFLGFRIFSYLKFFDESLEEDAPENYYMEREWRVVGNIQFGVLDVKRVIIPESYAGRLRSALPTFTGQVTFI